MRYLTLYVQFLKFSFIRAMHFRVDFFFRIVMDSMYYAASITFYYLIYSNLDFIDKWNFEQILVFVSFYLLVDAFEMTLFSSNFWWLPSRINKGEVDYYVLRPVSSQFFLTLREFAVNSLVNLLMVSGLLIYAVNQAFEQVDIWVWLRVASGLTLAIVLSYSLQILVAVPAFWTQSSSSMAYLFHYLNDAREKPVFIYRSWFKYVFTFLFPVCVITYYPSEWILEYNWNSFFFLAAITAVFFCISRFLWLQAIRTYGSASS